MPAEFFLLLIIIITGFGLLAFLIRHWILNSQSSQKPDLLISELLRSFDTRATEQSQEIRQQTKSLNERLDNAARIIGQVQKNIGEFSEIGRGMKDLQEFLRSPKLRGNIGEEVLADLIGQMFPKHNFFLQHSFRSGVRVDAAIKTDGGILPIDAKFPMENYQRMVKAETELDREQARREFTKDVRRHIDAIANKYILPDEGTLDFALMYVPAEPVYYEIVQVAEIMDWAKRARVYPVSPTTLYAHLQTILLTYAGKQIEVKTKEVFKLLRSMVSDFEKLQGNVGVLGRHITNAYNQMNNVTQGLTQMGQKLDATQMIEETAVEKLPE